jgi:uncharacterized protein YegL
VSNRLGGTLARRPLHFFWITDSSGSMAADNKIQSLNNAIRESVPHMQAAADENPQAEVLVRAITFSNGAKWHIAQPTPIETFKWVNLKADGLTDMGKAFMMVADQLKMPPMTDRALPPVLVLVSDGEPTDDYNAGLKALLAEPWGRRAARLAIAIGADANMDVLQKFIGHAEVKPLQANNAEMLVRYIRWVSTAVLSSAVNPPSQPQNPSVANVPVPIPVAPASTPISATDTW